MDRPIVFCEFVGLDGCCVNPLNQTPECHEDACPELKWTIHFRDGTSAVIKRGPTSNGVYLNGHLMPGFRSIYGFLKWVKPFWRALGWLAEDPD